MKKLLFLTLVYSSFTLELDQGQRRVCLSLPSPLKPVGAMKTQDSYPDQKKKTTGFFVVVFFFLFVANRKKPGLSSGVWMHLITGIIFLPKYWKNIFKPFQSRTLFKAVAMLL